MIVNSPQAHRFERNKGGRDFVVGDVHGCFTALQIALDSIGFSFASNRLFCTGDLVDRGAESHLVSSWLDTPRLFSARGNHDEMTGLRALPASNRNPLPIGDGEPWFLDLAEANQVQIGDTLRSLPLAIQVQTSHGFVGIVHADFPTHDWGAINSPFSESDRETCLWSTKRFDRMDTKEIAGLRALIHGHVTLSTARKLGNVHFIDTGGWMPHRGHFTFLELQSLQPVRGPGLDLVMPKKRNR